MHIRLVVGLMGCLCSQEASFWGTPWASSWGSCAPCGRALSPTLGVLWQAALGCRAAQVLMQYCILANHYWFLVEAVYLYKLLIGAVFSEKNYYRLYLYLGWGRSHPGAR